MALRHHHEENRKWQIWLKANRDTLAGCPIPEVVWEDRRHWRYFLDHGHFQKEGVVIDVDHLEGSVAERLCSFLEKDPFHARSHTLNRLQLLLKRGIHGIRPDASSV